LADPVPIVAGFTADPALRWHFKLGLVVTVVDAVNGVANLERFPEAMKQVALADRLVVSKIDLADPAPLLDRLRSLNPGASLQLSTETAPTPATLLIEHLHDATARAAEMARWVGAEPIHHGHHPAGPATFCLTADTPLDWAAFGLWLSLLLHTHGVAILRVKGLLQVQGVERPVVVQGVQHLVHKPLHLDDWPEGRPQSRLVVIGTGLDRAAIERSFHAFCRLGRRIPALASIG
jgi:G3E family GTPase